MTKLWFRTKNDQIIDLNDMRSFWLEEIDTFSIFCVDSSPDQIDWRLCEFDTKEEAQAYLDDIYTLLTKHQHIDLQGLKDCGVVHDD